MVEKKMVEQGKAGGHCSAAQLVDSLNKISSMFEMINIDIQIANAATKHFVTS